MGPRMSTRYFPNWLRAFAEHTELSEAPRAYHFWTGVSTIAGALRRQVWIDQRYFQWTANFYIVLVGPPGIVTKSTSMRTGIKMLQELPGVHMGPQSMTWQGLTLSLAESADLVPFGADFLPMSCITCDVSELGTFLRPEDPRMLDVLTDLWDGQLTKWTHKLRTQEGITLQNPWINILACTTPSWIRKNIPEQMVGGGLISRIVFVYGDEKRHLVPYPSDVIETVEHKEREKHLIDDLILIGKMIGEYELTAEAKAWGSAWYEKHWTTRPEHLANERFEGYIGRKQTHMHKLAIVLAAAESSELKIQVSHLQIAHDMLSGIERDMVKVFEYIGQEQTSQHVHALMEFVRVYKRIERRALWRLCMRNMSMQEFSDATTAAQTAELITLHQVPGGVEYRMRDGRTRKVEEENVA